MTKKKPEVGIDYVDPTGAIKRTAFREEDAAQLIEAGWKPVEEVKRPRRKRVRNFAKQAIKDGVIADPNNPALEVEYKDNVTVFRAPVATLEGGSAED